MTHIEPDGELAMQLKRISDQLGFLEKKIDQLLEQRSGGGAPRFGGDRQGGGFAPKRNFVKNYGRTRTAFYEGGGQGGGGFREGGYQGGAGRTGGYQGGAGRTGGYQGGARQGGGFREGGAGRSSGGGFREGGFRGRNTGGDFRRTGGAHKGGAARFDRKHTPRS